MLTKKPEAYDQFHFSFRRHGSSALTALLLSILLSLFPSMEAPCSKLLTGGASPFLRARISRLDCLNTIPVACLSTAHLLPPQIITLEGSNTNVRIFADMRRGAEEMKKARGHLDVDQVDDVMDDIQEEMDVSQKVSCW